MAMFMVKPWYGKSGPATPDECFDPTTHIATEENFINFLEFGVYDSKYVGYKVQLSNGSGYYNKGIWIIADVNHDSTNTGQTNCYDLMARDIVSTGQYGTNNQNWRNAPIRNWLNGTFYNGFSSDFKKRILNIKYKSQNSWYTDDKIIVPSQVEIKGGNDNSDIEGIYYPIFTGSVGKGENSSRRKLYNGEQYTWWTRSRYTKTQVSIVWVYKAGDMGAAIYSTDSGIVPLVRVQ